MKFYQNWTGYSLIDGKRGEGFIASVPGNIQYDYGVANNFGDVNYGQNFKKYGETEDWSWEYSTELAYEAKPSERVFFVSEGIDYLSEIYLNGTLLHAHEGMFTKIELDVTDLLSADKKNELTVRVLPHPKRKGSIKGDRQEADASCKPPVSYGWDWNPRLLISGLWMPAYIETRGAHYIEKCEPFYTLNSTLDRADVHFDIECGGEYTLTLTDGEGNVVYSGNTPDFTLENPKLWWCNGQGEPNLYHWTLKTDDDEKSGQMGFRKVKLVMNEGAKGEPDGFPKSRYPAPITVELNGRRIFAKGSNWVNPDVFWGNITKERYETLIRYAKDANMNIFRLWGGASVNKPEFYDLCDKYGIMVWQEFMLACNNYKGTPHYLAVLEQEATAILRALRSHPSITIWCGGNELFNGWSGMDEQSHALRLLDKLCYENDFNTPFIMTSPLNGMAHGCYVFYDEGWGMNGDVFEEFQRSHNTAYTEFGVPALSLYEDLERIIPEDEFYPIERGGAWEAHHAFNAWGEDRWLCLNVLDHYKLKYNSVKDICDHSQWLQSEGYKAAFEEIRKQWPYCSMAVNWCYQEPWVTAANNSLFTYPEKPKPAYFAVKDALRPVLASARIPHFDWRAGQNFTAELWYLNDSCDTVSDTVSASVVIGGKEYPLIDWSTGDVAPRSNKQGHRINFKLPALDAEFFILKLTSANGVGSEYKLRYYKPEAPKAPSRQLNV